MNQKNNEKYSCISALASKKSSNLMLFIIYLSYIFLIRLLLKAWTEIQKNFFGSLAQMKSLEFAFEINLPLVFTEGLTRIMRLEKKLCNTKFALVGL